MSWVNNTINIFNINIHALNRVDAVATCIDLLNSSLQLCSYVVTPNLDHIIKLRKSADFRRAYAGATLVLADGNPIVWASKLFNQPLPGVVTGSDLVPDILAAWPKYSSEILPIFILGAGPGVAELAAKHIEKIYPKIKVVGFYSPPHGFEANNTELSLIVDIINSSNARLLIIGLGAPKQEIWIHNHSQLLNVRLSICGGAVIDFLAGVKPRAPKWIRNLALEWLFRMACEPRRLIIRYIECAIFFPFLLLSELIKKK